MKTSVAEAFVKFTAPLEGVVPFMYLDIKGLVTTAIGNLIDPMPAALRMPWKKKDGELASQVEIQEEWNRIKARQDLKMRGGMIYKNVATLHLDDSDIQQIVMSKLYEMENYLKNRFSCYDCWPADAQLGILSLSWACGPAFRFPKFEAAVKNLDFTTAAIECKMKEEGNPGIVPRNKANKLLFSNAAKVMADGLDKEKLFWPAKL